MIYVKCFQIWSKFQTAAPETSLPRPPPNRTKPKRPLVSTSRASTSETTRTPPTSTRGGHPAGPQSGFEHLRGANLPAVFGEKPNKLNSKKIPRISNSSQ